MPRTAYYGIVTFIYGRSRVYAIPSLLDYDRNFTKFVSSDVYNDKWDKMTKFLEFQEIYCKPNK